MIPKKFVSSTACQLAWRSARGVEREKAGVGRDVPALLRRTWT
jgi:hypothetical protein